MKEPDETASLADWWETHGGIATDGTTYVPPDQAKAWGTAGCPLLPRSYRARYASRRVPPALSTTLTGAEDLTFSELDTHVLARFGLEALSREGLKAIRDTIYRLPVPTGQMAIPTGVPLAWILGLPIRGRAYRAIRRIFSTKSSADVLEEPVSFEEFLQVKPAGRTTLIELLCVLESAERQPPPSSQSKRLETVTQRIATAKFERSVREAARDAIRTASILGDDMRRFAAWALAETETQTIGDAVSKVLLNKEVVEEWESLAKLKLEELVGQPIHPFAVLDAWAEELNVRERLIFSSRIADSANRRTLRELGEQLGTSRERVRQIETKILRNLSKFIEESSEAQPIRWRVETLKRKLGTAAPSAYADRFLPSMKGVTDYSLFMLRLAGPYDAKDGWLTLRSAASTDPTAAISAMADEFGRIDVRQAAKKLSDWGLGHALHMGWLKRHREVRLFNGQLVVWGTSLGDRLAFALGRSWKSGDS